MKTLYNPKMLLTKDSVVSVQSNSVLSASGKDYPADFIVSAGLKHWNRNFSQLDSLDRGNWIRIYSMASRLCIWT